MSEKNTFNLNKFEKQAARPFKDDEENFGYEDQTPEEERQQEYEDFGVTEQPQQIVGGFTSSDIDYFENLAIQSGFDEEELQNLRLMIETVSQSIADKVLGYAMGRRELEKWIKQTATAKGAPQIATDQVAPVETEQVAPVETEQPITPSPSQPTEKVEETVIEYGKLPEKLPENYDKNKDKLEGVGPVLEQTHGVIDPNSEIFATKQSKAFEKNFLVNNPQMEELIQKEAYRVVSSIRSNALKAGVNPPNLSVDDVKGSVWTSVHKALGISERVSPQTGIRKVLSDNRLAVFAYNESLVPPEAQEEWQQVKSEWDGVLRQEQAEAMEYNNRLFQSAGVADIEGYFALYGVAPVGKPYTVSNINKLPKGIKKPKLVPERLMANRKSTHFIEKNPVLANKLLAHLNRIINSGYNTEMGRGLSESVLRRAGNMAAYEIAYREISRKEKGMSTNMGTNEAGEELDVTQQISDEEGGKLSDRITSPVKGTLAENQKNLKRTTGLVTDLMDEVWDHLKMSTNDPETWSYIEKIFLKMQLFKYQSNLFSNTNPEQYKDVGISGVKQGKGLANEYGKISFDPKDENKTKTVFVTRNGKQEPVEIYVGLKEMISPQGVYNGYINMLKLKYEVIKQARVLGFNPDSFNAQTLKQAIFASNPKLNNPISEGFLNDEKWLKMALIEEPEKIKNDYLEAEANPKKASDFDVRYYTIWSHMAADTLMAVARKIQNFRQNPPKDEIQKEMLEQDLIRARQSFISIIKVHPTLIDDATSAKLGTNKKITSIIGVPITTKSVVQMIAGAIPIPESWIPILAGHRYAEASKAYYGILRRIEALHNIGSSMIKMAGNQKDIYDIADKMVEIWKAGNEEIRRIMRS